MTSHLTAVREAIEYVIPHYKVYGNTTFSDKLEAALTHLDALEALSASPAAIWRSDMENAPRDGAKIDLWVSGERITDAWFSTKRNTWVRWWMDDFGSMGECRIRPEPTHFMALPAAPSVNFTSLREWRGAAQESGWLIEMAESSPSEPRYVTVEATGADSPHTCRGELTWGSSHNAALRFSRRIDALVFVGAMKTLAEKLPYKDTFGGLRAGDISPRICEHIWNSPPTASDAEVTDTGCEDDNDPRFQYIRDAVSAGEENIVGKLLATPPLSEDDYYRCIQCTKKTVERGGNCLNPKCSQHVPQQSKDAAYLSLLIDAAKEVVDSFLIPARYFEPIEETTATRSAIRKHNALHRLAGALKSAERGE